jgi:DNA-binding NarL/FixJ family response regulator
MDSAEVVLIYQDEEFGDEVRVRLEAGGMVCRRMEFGDSNSGAVLESSPEIVIFALPAVTADLAQRIAEFVLRTRGIGVRHCVVCKSIDQDIEIGLFGRGVRCVVSGKRSLAQLAGAVKAVRKGEIWCTKAVLSALLESLDRGKV